MNDKIVLLTRLLLLVLVLIFPLIGFKSATSTVDRLNTLTKKEWLVSKG